jgi:hypothetical protein
VIRWLRAAALAGLALALAAPLAAGARQAAGLRLTIQTVPALAGIDFKVYRPCELYVPRSEVELEFCQPEPVPHLDSWGFTSDERGLAGLNLPAPGLYLLHVENSTPEDPGLQARFSRWQDDVFTNMRQLRLRGNRHLVAGLAIERPVQLAYLGPQDGAVQADRIQVTELRSSLGSVHHLEGSGPHWLPAEHILNRDAGLASVPIVYALQRVNLNGSNVVNRGQQRFTAELGTTDWQIDLLLYQADILARDAFFNLPAGDGAILEFPDGSTEEFAYSGPDGVRIDNLARGTYRVRAAGAAGIVFPAIMVLSRDQVVRPVVLSWLDLSLVAVGGLAGSLTLLFVGRPHLMPSFLRRPQRSSEGPS